MSLGESLKGLGRAYSDTSLILRIAVGIVIGAALALIAPSASWIGILGDIFVGALKAIAPVLVFVLIVSALSQGTSKLDKRFGLVIGLYVVSTLFASVTAVAASFLFPQTLVLADAASADVIPGDIGTVLVNLLTKAVANPVAAVAEANYIGILLWAAILGVALKSIAADATKTMLKNVSDGVTQIVRWIINLAPFGIMGLVFTSVATNGLEIFTTYGGLVLVLVSSMLFMVFVVTPVIVFAVLRRNPYPLIWRCIKESGITAFFTRSSAANIPVNMALCEKLGLDRDFYSVSIPLGATINMDGAAITIAVMTLACANTLGVAVDVPSALLLCVLATLGACGASGVAGGSLLLIPMACSLFGIGNDIAMQVVGIGFIIGVIQDSLETALNSSGDVIYCSTAEYRAWLDEGKPLPSRLGDTVAR